MGKGQDPRPQNCPSSNHHNSKCILFYFLDSYFVVKRFTIHVPMTICYQSIIGNFGEMKFSMAK